MKRVVKVVHYLTAADMVVDLVLPDFVPRYSGVTALLKSAGRSRVVFLLCVCVCKTHTLLTFFYWVSFALFVALPFVIAFALLFALPFALLF